MDDILARGQPLLFLLRHVRFCNFGLVAVIKKSLELGVITRS